MKKNSLQEMTKEISEFCKERGWNHSDPNHLLSAIMIEMGELAEHYQWQHEFKEFKGDEKTEVGYEFVDVAFYLLRLAELSDIDIAKYFYQKLPKLKKKFPVGMDVKTANREYRAQGKNSLYK